MPKLEITILDTTTGKTEKFETDGYLLLYMSGERIQMNGKLEFKALTPILTKILLERMTH